MRASSRAETFRQSVLFLIICFVVMALSGLFQPGDYYASLNKAPWTPPNLAFPIVWFVLYIFIAIAGQQIFAQSSKLLKWLWSVQLALNAAWSWLFFGQNWARLALIDIILISILVASLIYRCWFANVRTAAYLLGPYLLWLVLATSLNTYIVIAN